MDRFRFAVLTVVPMILVFVGAAAFVQGNWYEYHVLAPGETPQNLVNQDGWQPVPGMETRSGIALNYRRPRFLPHPNSEQVTASDDTAPSPTDKTIQAKASMLARSIRSFAIYSGSPASDKGGIVRSSYTSLRNAYTEFATELDTDGDTSDEAAAARAMVPRLKDAIETAYGTVNNDALISLAVQLDHLQ